MVVSKFYLYLPNFCQFLCPIIASIHITQVIIIFIIKFCYSFYTLIFRREKFEIRNSPLNRFASVLSQALYCIKFGCAVGGTGASFIAGGLAYDALLQESGREKKFLPFLANVCNGSLEKFQRILLIIPQIVLSKHKQSLKITNK
jgi:hypothetical protein